MSISLTFLTKLCHVGYIFSYNCFSAAKIVFENSLHSRASILRVHGMNTEQSALPIIVES